jgi:AcrR family transcriptional regulator
MIEQNGMIPIIEDGVAARHERSDAAANRVLILQAAERLFAERGVANVCMSEIAEAAGVGKGTLYRRFANKGELCLALMDRQMGEFQNGMLAQFARQTAEGLPYLGQLTAFLAALVEFTEIHSPLLIEVQHAGMIQDELQLNLPRLNLPHIWQYMTVSALLRSAARAGELDGVLDLEYLGEALLAPLQVDYFRFQRQVRGYSTERIAAGLGELVNLLGRE